MKIIGLMIVSFFEIWLLYYLLFGIFWKEEGMRRRDKVNMWSCILILGSMLTFNRNVAFFSHSMFATVIILFIFSVSLIRHEIPLFTIGCIVTYYSLLALLDFLTGFFNMYIFGDDFASSFYIRTDSLIPCVGYMVSRVITALAIWAEKEKLQTIGKDACYYQKILLIIGGVFGVMVRRCQFVMYGLIVEKNGKNPGSVGITILTITVIILFITLLIIKYKSIEMQNEMLTLKEKVFEEEYENLLQMMEKNGQLFHDMKNHLLILSNYAEQGDIESISNYIKEMGNNLCTEKNGFWTGNRILDLVISQKRSVAKRKEIDFQIQASRLPQLSIKDSEICALFGNLLDNAIEACEKIQSDKRWIVLNINTQESLMYICISNNVAAIPQKKKERFVSEKPNKSMHGFGLKSVERIVKRHGGLISYDTKGDSFRVGISFFKLEN